MSLRSIGRTLTVSRPRSNPLGELCARGALGSRPDRLRRTGHDAHLHLHAEMVRREPDEGAVERDRVVRIADDRNGDKADLADAAARGVAIDPAGTRQVDLRPGMGRPASRAAHPFLRIVERDGEIPGCKPRGETERPRRLDHQHGEIAAAAMADPERLDRLLDSLRFPPPVAEAMIDAL